MPDDLILHPEYGTLYFDEWNVATGLAISDPIHDTGMNDDRTWQGSFTSDDLREIEDSPFANERLNSRPLPSTPEKESKLEAEPTTFSLARQFARSIREGHSKAAFISWLKAIERGRGNSRSSSILRAWGDRSILHHYQFIELFNLIIDAVDARLILCSDCAELLFEDDGTTVNDGDDTVCDSCYNYHYFTCECCGAHRHDNDNVSVNGYGTICQGCADGRVSFDSCADCGEYYLSENLYWDEDREGSYCEECKPRTSMCKPLHLKFEFPALCTPKKKIQAEEIVTITVGQGDISPEGISAIRNLIYNKTSSRNYGYGVDIPEITQEHVMERQWQTKEGNFPKRLAKHLLVERNMKLTEEIMAEIGNLAKLHSARAGNHYLSLTRNLNQSASEFVHSGSCWWNSEIHSRCELKAWHGFGVRTWNTPEEEGPNRRPITRAWLLPLNLTDAGRFSTVPTHELPAPAYLLFNSYEMDQVAYARIIAGMTGKSYKKVELAARMYINNGTAMLIAEQSLCTATRVIELPSKSTCRGGCR